ncbi:MAG: hypothetical protein V4550_00035 [Gemmatimonadota bacterium]
MHALFLFLAVVGGSIGVLQALGALVGIVGHDAPDQVAEHQLDGGHPAVGAGTTLDVFHFRSVRAIAAGVAFMGLGGLLALRQFSGPIALALALLLGVAIYLFVAFVMRGFTRLEADGSIRAAHAIGCSATVTLPVGGEHRTGKVALVLGGRHVEYPAILSESAPADTRLVSGTRVQIVDASDDMTLSVVPLP